jgi:HSP20 family protein
MWTRFGDVDTGWALFDELRRRLDRISDDFEPAADSFRASFQTSGYPPVNVYDTGATLTLQAEVAGLSQKDIRLSVQDGTVTIEGERKSDAPEGYSVHRRERGALRFSRSFSLPVKTDAEHAEASVKDGVLTVVLPKAKEAQPRQIQVRAS